MQLQVFDEVEPNLRGVQAMVALDFLISHVNTRNPVQVIDAVLVPFLLMRLLESGHDIFRIDDKLLRFGVLV